MVKIIRDNVLEYYEPDNMLTLKAYILEKFG